MTRFRQHDKECRLSSTTLDEFLRPSAPPNAAATKSRSVPCPGLQGDSDELITLYLQRTGASGGGGRDFREIAKEIFGKLFSKLKGQQKREVLDRKRQTNAWKNDHQTMRVFSTSCHESVVVRGDSTPLPCFECLEVRELKSFKKAISRSEPEKDKKKYTNKMYPNEALGKHYAGSKGLQELVEDEVR